jgi:hypothetical protein
MMRTFHSSEAPNQAFQPTPLSPLRAVQGARLNAGIRGPIMPTAFRALFAFALLLTNGLANADDAVSIFAGAVEQKLSRLAEPTNEPQTDDAAPEQTILVDVTSDGSVISVKDQAPVANKAASAKLHRLILMGSPFPQAPKSLADYSAIRLAVVYAAYANNPVVVRVEVKGGFQYVEF